MMSQDQAAKYFIVAWVKGWSLRMYLDTVGGKGKVSFDDAHKAYPWLPRDAGWFYRNQTVRRYIADAFRKFNDKIWDAKDNVERLALSGVVLKLVGGDVRQTVSDASRAMYKSKQEYRSTAIGNMASIDAMRRGSGHHWGVVK